jgi:hypothetical protein
MRFKRLGLLASGLAVVGATAGIGAAVAGASPAQATHSITQSATTQPGATTHKCTNMGPGSSSTKSGSSSPKSSGTTSSASVS